MKKTIVFLATLCLLFAFGHTLAEKQINPYYTDAVVPDDVRNGIMLASDMALTITCTTQPEVGQEGKWSIGVDGGTAPYTYRYYILDSDWNTAGYFDWSASSECGYPFVASGEYMLLVYVRDSAGNIANKILEFEVSGSTTVSAVVKQIVAECMAAGSNDDFEIALWLHDWLTSHACYDETYRFYSADGVLIRGTGVCDSYSKAYSLLLEEAGLSSKRVIGGNHSWNMVQMDGDWYHIDPTWDDPTGLAQAAVSGAENHFYFGLPDDIMLQDHTYTVTEPCISYANNYYIRSGKISLWTDAFVQEINARLKTNDTSFAVQLAERYAIENTSYMLQTAHIVGSLSAYVLDNKVWQIEENSVLLTISYEAPDNALLIQVIPAELTEFEPNDFPREANPWGQKGRWLKGCLTSESDRDYFLLTFPKDQNIRIDIEQISSSKVIAELFDASNRLLFTSVLESEPGTITPITQGSDWLALENYLLRLGGDFYLKISGSQGEYALRCSDDPSIRPNKLTVSDQTAYIGDPIRFCLQSYGSGSYAATEYQIANENGQLAVCGSLVDGQCTFIPESEGVYSCIALLESDTGLSWTIQSDAVDVKRKFALNSSDYRMSLESSETYEYLFELNQPSVLDFSVRMHQGIMQFEIVSGEVCYMKLDGLQNVSGNDFTETNQTISVPPGTYVLRMHALASAHLQTIFDIQLQCRVNASDTLILQALEVNSQSITLGEAITATIKTTGSGQIDAMEYHVYNTSGQHITSQISSAETFSFTPSTADTYILRVYLKPIHGEWSYVDSLPVQALPKQHSPEPIRLNAFYTDIDALNVGEQINFVLNYDGSDATAVTNMLFYTYDGYGNQLGDPWIYPGFIGHYGFISSAPGYYSIRVFMLTDDGGEQVVTSPFFRVTDPDAPACEPLVLSGFSSDRAEAEVGEQINFLLTYSGNDTARVGRMLFYTYDSNGQQLGSPWIYDGFIGHYGFISSIPGSYAIRVFMLTNDGEEQVITSPFFMVHTKTDIEDDSCEPTAESDGSVQAVTPEPMSEQPEQTVTPEPMPEPPEQTVTPEPMSEQPEQTVTPEPAPEQLEQTVTPEPMPEQPEQTVTPEPMPEQPEQTVTPESVPEQPEQAVTPEPVHEPEQPTTPEAEFALEQPAPSEPELELRQDDPAEANTAPATSAT